MFFYVEGDFERANAPGESGASSGTRGGVLPEKGIFARSRGGVP